MIISSACPLTPLGSKGPILKKVLFLGEDSLSHQKVKGRWEVAGCENLINRYMVEPLLSGIVLGLVPVTIAGLFVTAYLQYRRGDLASF